jgi:hypothetical protein
LESLGELKAGQSELMVGQREMMEMLKLVAMQTQVGLLLALSQGNVYNSRTSFFVILFSKTIGSASCTRAPFATPPPPHTQGGGGTASFDRGGSFGDGFGDGSPTAKRRAHALATFEEFKAMAGCSRQLGIPTRTLLKLFAEM